MMISTMMNFVQSAVEFSLLGCVEVASVALVVYFVYAKTRAPAIIASLFPNLNLNINYRSSLVRFNNMGNELLISLRTGAGTTKSETKPQITLAHGVGTHNMLELTPHAGRKPYYSWFDWGVYFPHIAQQLRSKKFPYPQVSSLVEKDPVLQRAIKQAAEQILREQRISKAASRSKSVAQHAAQPPPQPATNGGVANSVADHADDYIVYQEILQQQERRARSILRDMRSTVNNFLLKLTSWLLYKLLPCFLTGVVTHTKQIEMLKAASERAPGIPLIFLPLHRSHLDYIMVTYILLNNDIKSPLVAAGNNLQIPVFGGLLRGLGAFFIKRKIDPVVGKKDILYRAALQLYLQHALKTGHNVEFFIEGGRTRTGKPCMPKGGILSVIVNAFMDRSIPDALLVPVSVNYERLVDGNFVREQKGEKKVPESFGKAISGIWKTLNSKYGLMRIDFNQPYSIRELVQSYNQIAKEEVSSTTPGTKTQKVCNPSARTLQHNQSTSSLYGTDVVCEEHRNLIESISRQVVYDCAAATSLMSTNALAFLFLTRYRNGAPEKDIARSLDDLRDRLKGRKDIGFSGDSLNIVHYARDLLGKDLVARVQNDSGLIILRPVGTVDCMIELAYYSNLLTPYFALHSIVLTTFHALLPPKPLGLVQNDATAGVVRTKLIEAALENCALYRYEFILSKPTQTLENMLEKTVDELLIEGYIQCKQLSDLVAEDMAEGRRIAANISAYIDEGEDNDFEHFGGIEEDDLFFATVKSTSEHKAICEVLAPFSYSYLAVAQSLCVLFQNPMLETEFIKFVINDITNKVQKGSCAYAESISTDSVRNCLKLLEKWSVIEICNEHGMRLLSLGALYETSKDSLKTIVQRFNAIVPNYKNGYF